MNILHNIKNKLLNKKINFFGIIIDISNKKIIIPKGFKIIFEGDAYIEGKENIFISSNYKNIDSKTNKTYKICLNCEE